MITNKARSRSKETEKYHNNLNLNSVHRLIMSMSIAVLMGSLPTLSKTVAPSSCRHRNHDSLIAALNNKLRVRYHWSDSLKSKRKPVYLNRNPVSSRSFTSTSAFAFNKYSKLPRTKIQSPLLTTPWLRSPWTSPSNDSIVSRHTSTNNIDETTSTDRKEFVSQKLPPGTTIYDALSLSLQLLEDHSVPEPDESVLHLLSHALELSWESGYRQLREILALSSSPITSIDNSRQLQNQSIIDLAQQALTPEQSVTFHSLLERRLKFEPLQYIVGQWDFHYLTGLKIRKPMLCPRPETEELVELVLADIDHLIQQGNIHPDEERKIRVLDVGCGTGAIGIAIAHRYPKHVQVVALDVLPEAVDLSNENADTLLSGLIGGNGDAKEVVGNLYESIVCSAIDFTNKPIDPTVDAGTNGVEQKYKMNFDIIVSNPPYIPTKDMQDLSTDVVGYESHGALCGGDDGLNVVRDIVHRLSEWMSPTGASPKNEVPRHCWMEVDDSHPSMLEQWLAPGSKESTRVGVQHLNSRSDFCGRDRFVLLSIV